MLIHWNTLEDAWLSEIALVIARDIGKEGQISPEPAALNESWQRQHLFEALSQAVLVKSLPLLLTIDDLQVLIGIRSIGCIFFCVSTVKPDC